MKRRLIVSTLLILALLLCGCAQKAPASTPTPTSAPTAIPAPTAEATATPAPTPTPSESPLSPEEQALMDENKEVWREMHNREYMEGRLLIPSVGIDVALITWGTEPSGESNQDKIIEIVRQDVVDQEDSALLYFDDPVGNIIADHSNQDFVKLTDVKVGDAAYILSGDRMVTLECSFTTDGINTGYGITDMDGGWHHDNADYVCYTCLEDWTHIQIVGFEMKDEQFIDMDWIDVGDANESGSSTAGATATSTSTSSNNGVATTISLPAPASTVEGAGAEASPEPTAPVSTTATPQPTEAPAAAQPAAREPVYYDPPVEYDIYADSDSTFGIYYSNVVDGYLG